MLNQSKLTLLNDSFAKFEELTNESFKELINSIPNQTLNFTEKVAYEDLPKVNVYNDFDGSAEITVGKFEVVEYDCFLSKGENKETFCFYSCYIYPDGEDYYYAETNLSTEDLYKLTLFINNFISK